jgi:hypothetical protein
MTPIKSIIYCRKLIFNAKIKKEKLFNIVKKENKMISKTTLLK